MHTPSTTMATKRQAPDDSTAQQSFRKRHKPGSSTYSNKPLDLGKKSFKKAHPVNDLKSKIRNLRRLLEHNEDLPANVRVEKERALQTAHHDLEQAQRAKKRSEIIGRWHKVRFFDRQKAERRLKKKRKEVKILEDRGDAGEDEVESVKGEVKDLEVDVNYAIYFPLERDYVSLYPTRRKKGDEEGEEAAPEEGEGKRQGDAEMWEKVKRCMEEGTLQDLREGRLEGDGAELDSKPIERPQKVKKKESKKPQKPQKAGKQREERRETTQEGHREESEESDDDGQGFFET